jgi:hypothetical protein
LVLLLATGAMATQTPTLEEGVVSLFCLFAPPLPSGWIFPRRGCALSPPPPQCGMHTTPATITRDLEQMKAKGITGFILYDAGAAGAGHAGKTFQFRTILVGKEFHHVQADDCKDAYDRPISTKPLAVWMQDWCELNRFVAKESTQSGSQVLPHHVVVCRLGTRDRGIRQFCNKQLNS